MVRAYRGGTFYGLSEVRNLTGSLNPVAAANPVGNLRDRLQVNFLMTYSGTTHTVTSGWAGVTDYLTSEPTPFDSFSIHAADKSLLGVSTDWDALTGFAVAGSTGNYAVTQVNIYSELDPSDWTYSEALTAMLVPAALLAKISRDTADAASSSYTTTSTVPVVVDATNLEITFVAPSSGEVRIDASLVFYTSTTSVLAFVGLLTGAGAYVPGTEQAVGSTPTPGIRVTPHWLIRGLTPGVSYTYRLAMVVSGGTMTIPYGGNTSGSVSVGATIFGPIQMEVWRA
jgi:hypothetical protein